MNAHVEAVAGRRWGRWGRIKIQKRSTESNYDITLQNETTTWPLDKMAPQNGGGN